MQTITKLALAILAVFLAASGVIAQVDAGSIEPSEIHAAVAQPGYTLLLLTSGDAGCGYCKGQDKLFDEVAGSYKGALRMRQVSWSPWSKLPDQKFFPRTIYGVPIWQLFEDGKFVAESSGRMLNAAQVRFFVENAIADQELAVADPRQGEPLERLPEDYRLSKKEREAIGLLARRDAARKAFMACAAVRPQDHARYRRAMVDYDKRHAQELAQARGLQKTLRGKRAQDQVDAVIVPLYRRMEHPREMIRKPTADGCRRIVQESMP